MYHVDLRRLANYRIAVEKTRERLGLGPLVKYESGDGQEDSIVCIGDPSQSGNDFFKRRQDVMDKYV